MAFTGSSWGRRVKLTGLTPASTLSGYVAVITLDNIPAEAIDAGANSALNGGGDLRFSTDDAGVTQLPCEVVSFVTSATAGLRECEIHVRFGTYSSAAREVWMFYNKAGESQPVATDTYGRNAVWSDYLRVFHMGDNVDSCGNGDMTLVGSPGSVPGPIGSGMSFNGSNQRADLGFNTLTADYTLRTIFKPTNNAAAIGGRGPLHGNSPAISWDQNAGTTPSVAHNTVNWSNVYLSVATGGATYWISSTYDGLNLKAYLDGALDGSFSDAGALASKDNFVLASHASAPTTRWLDCEIYFAAISDAPASPDMLALEYSNQSSPATFWTVGTPEDTGGGGLTLEAAVSFGVSQGFSLTAQSVSSASFVQAISAAQALSAQANTEGSTVAATSAGADSSAQMIAGRSISSAFAASATNTSQADATATHSAGIQAGFSLTATAQVDATITATSSAGFNVSGVAGAGAVVESSVSFVTSLASTVTATADILGAIAVEAQTGASASAQAQATASIAVTQNMSSNVIAEAAAHAGITAAQVLGASFDGTTFSGDVVTPDGRTYHISAEARIFTVEPEDRTYTIQ